MLILDLLGTFVFAISGAADGVKHRLDAFGVCARKALALGINPLVAALLGMLTGIGGGMLRDLLVREIPVVLRAELYALAALAGAAVVILGDQLGWPAIATAVAGAILCFAMQVIAIRRGWNLPTANGLPF